MTIPIIKDYTVLAEKLKAATKAHECRVRIIDAEKNHFHFGMYNKYAQHIALICYKDGEITISPFKSVNALVREDQFIPLKYFAIANDFCDAFLGLKEFLIEKGENGNA